MIFIKLIVFFADNLSMFRSKNIKSLLILLFLSCAFCSTYAKKKVMLGIDRIDEYSHIFANKRVALITNSTGYDSRGKSSIVLLKEKVNLVLLFAPEHGLKGNYKEGALIENSKDVLSGLKVYSLYGKQKKPTREMLQDVDIVCFDIQDVGARFYTYIYTMAYAMEACKEWGKTFVVFDRPNPIGGDVVEGFILKKDFASFVGLYPIAQRHGMTVGELALMFNSKFGINAHVEVVPMKGWERRDYFEDLHLIWHPTSPNIPTAETALIYSGFCIFEGCNVSVGRGTTMPFRYVGAPFINGVELADSLQKQNLEGVSFFPSYFEPSTSIYKGEACEGVYIVPTNKRTFRPVRTALALYFLLKKLYPNEFKVNDSQIKRCGLNLLFGNDILLQKTIDQDVLSRSMKENELEFLKMRQAYLLYK